MFRKPKNGQYYIINASITNNGDKEFHSSSLSMYLKDEEGNKYRDTFVADTESTLGGTIIPGDKQKGEVAYDISPDAKGLYFYYSPTLGSKTVKIKLDR